MRDLIIRSLVLLAAITMIASNFTNTNHAMTTDTNPLLAKWEGPFGGVPSNRRSKPRWPNNSLRSTA
jgi:hypothetical protein